MNTLIDPKNHIVLVLFLILALLMACMPSTSPVSSTPSASTATTSASTPDQPAANEEAAGVNDEPDPLDRLLDLHQVKIGLSSQRPDGSQRSTEIEIDQGGNMRVKYSLPVVDPALLQKETDLSQLPPSRAVFVVDGKVYMADPLDPQKTSTPLQTHYTQMLTDELHGVDGPGFYLDLLPEGSIKAAGKDNSGGFEAEKYAVNGEVSGQAIRGTIWFEPKTDALIRAELTVPMILYGGSGQAVEGEVKITLNTEQAAISPVEAPGAAAPATSEQPSIAATYPLSSPGSFAGLEGVLTTSPGRVWVAGKTLGSLSSTETIPGIQEWDADAGQVVNTIPLPQAAFFWDIQHDGQFLWVLASKTAAAYADILYAISLPDGQVVKEWESFNQGDYGWQPTQIGVSPGKIWVANKIIDTPSFQEEDLGKTFVLPAGAFYSYDGKQWMWATGSRCDGCKHDLWMFDANDPRKIENEDGTGAPNTATMGQPIVQANGKVWLGIVKDIKTENGLFTGTPCLVAYDFDKTDLPSLSVDISGELGAGLTQIGLLAADNHAVWLGDKYGSKTLYYHDQNDGKLLGSLELDTISIVDLAFDGKNLWILDADNLVRVALPWAP